MSTLVVTKILFLLLLLLFSGFFSGSEVSLFSLGRVERVRLQEEGTGLVARCLRDLVQDPRRLLITIMIGNEVVNITISALAASFTDDLFSAWWHLDVSDRVLLKTLGATALCTPLLLILGEMTPKTLALLHPRRFASGVAVPLRLFYGAVGPLRWFLAGLADRIVGLVFGEGEPGEPPISEEEFRSLVDLGRKEGVLWESEHEFIHNIFDFGETRVAEVMTPRTEMFCVQVDQELEEILAALERQPYSRIPVYEKDKDDIVGLLYCKDLLEIVSDPQRRARFNLRALLRKPYFIPQSKKASDLFREFRINRIHLAIVVDEYGGVAGLVTMEDLLEELFGEILDEYDPDEPGVRRLDPKTMIIPARMSVEEFNRRTGAGIPEEEYDTMGGLVFDLFGRLPAPGAKVSYMHYTFTVEKMVGTRILELRVEGELDREPADDGSPGGRPDPNGASPERG